MVYVSKLDALITAGSQKYAKQSQGGEKSLAGGLLTDVTSGNSADLINKNNGAYGETIAHGQINVFPTDSYHEACFFILEHEQHVAIMGMSILEEIYEYGGRKDIKYTDSAGSTLKVYDDTR